MSKRATSYYDSDDSDPPLGRHSSKVPRITFEQQGGLMFLLRELERENALPLLQQHGIRSIEDLIRKTEALQGMAIKRALKRDLIAFCEWYDDFYCHHSRSVNWMDFFHEDVLEPTSAASGASSQRSPEEIFSYIIHTLHDESRPVLKYSEMELQRMLESEANRIVNALPTNLKNQCFFDMKEYVKLWIQEIADLPRSSGDSKPDLYLAFGRTQAGKSSLKAVLFAVCQELQIDLFIITKGVAESKDLFAKIREKLNESLHKRSAFIDVLHVVADTKLQIERLVKKIQKSRADIKKQKRTRKFVVIADECDAYLRTEDGTQKMEQAFNSLIDLKPSLRVEISATLMPSLICYVLEKELEVKMLQIGTSEDYSGIEQMRPFEQNGKQVYLSPLKKHIRDFKSGVSPNGGNGNGRVGGVDFAPLFGSGEILNVNDEVDQEDHFSAATNQQRIPFTNEDCIAFYNSASDGKGILLLDITNPRVTVIDNIFDKAAAVQNMLSTRKKDVIIVVHVGAGIYIRRPGYEQGRVIKGARISDVIQQLDDEFGIGVPIFLFGYTKMRRCISQRSRNRVPTHILLSLGKGHSIENFVQALGRGTFNGRKSVLKENGHEYVKVLTDKDDFTAAHKYVNFFDHFVGRIRQGDSTEDALAGASGKFPDSTNFLRHSNRKIGLRKDFRERFRDMDIFEELEDEEEELELQVYQGDPSLQAKYGSKMFLQHLRILSGWYYQVGRSSDVISTATVRRMFLSAYKENGLTISKDAVQNILKCLKKDKVVAQKDRGWQVVDWDAAMWLISKLCD